MVGVIDSGIGGLFVLKQCLRICPDMHYIYLSDNNNIPYGNKNKRKLIRIARNNCTFLINKGCDVIIFACNTLTAVAINKCRKCFPFIKFIGIEPAIKPALQECKKILVLCTHATFKYSKLLRSFKKDKRLVFAPQKKLAEDIENGKKIKLDNYFLQNGYDGVVLGCTHYNFIRRNLSKYLGTKQIFEASDGVARRLLSFRLPKEPQSVDCYFSGQSFNLNVFNKIIKK